MLRFEDVFGNISVRIGFLVLMVSFLVGGVHAQTAPGVLDNYSGSSSAWLNPSNISTTFVHDDVGLASLSFSLGNNFAYLPPRTFIPSLRGLMAPGGTWATFEGQQDDHPYYYEYYPGTKDRFAYQAMDVVVPSMMLTLGHNHAVAFSLRSRFYTSVVRMPWEIPVLITESLKYPPMQHVRYASNDMRFSTMAWEEADLSYSTKVFDHGALKMDAGVTGKMLFGVAGVSLETPMLDYSVLNSEQLRFYDLDSEVNLALPMDYGMPFHDLDTFVRFNDPLVKGLGLGADVGITLTYKTSTLVRTVPRDACDDRPEYYYWRLGVSLIDVGSVRFGKNVLQGQLSGQDFVVNFKDFDTVTMINGGTVLLDSIVGNSVTAFRTGESFRIGLPTALSVQYDLNLYRDFYANLTWVQPVSRWLYDAAVEREAMLSLTPRYETSFLGVAVPVTLYDYRYVTAGAYVRVGPLTLGTSDLISLLGIGKTRSIDFQVGLRLKLDRGDCLFGRIYDACGDKIRRIKYRH